MFAFQITQRKDVRVSQTCRSGRPVKVICRASAFYGSLMDFLFPSLLTNYSRQSDVDFDHFALYMKKKIQIILQSGGHTRSVFTDTEMLRAITSRLS